MHQNINGDSELIAIERAINELRCGRAIYCRELHVADARQPGALLAAAETVSVALLSRLEQLAGETGVTLAITQQRAETLGLERLHLQTDGGAILLRLHRPVSSVTVSVLAGLLTGQSASNQRASGRNAAKTAQRIERGSVTSHVASSMRQEFTHETGNASIVAAVNLAKRARLLPAVLMVASPQPSAKDEVLEISVSQLERLGQPGVLDLERVSEAQVPLVGHEDCRLVLFRDGRDASEHVAVVIGSPDADVVPVRLHSACLTGDLLGSLRCDCGDQLRSAVDQLAAADGGVLLYLAQEGRGIGLANKLRAYELQDAGLDTIEADRHLGFRADERSYTVAASMLRHLGMTRIHLFTNNLEKIDALQKAGIEVVAGQRLLGAVNRHNARYIRAKRERAGHLMPEVKVEGL